MKIYELSDVIASISPTNVYLWSQISSSPCLLVLSWCHLGLSTSSQSQAQTKNTQMFFSKHKIFVKKSFFLKIPIYSVTFFVESVN